MKKTKVLWLSRHELTEGQSQAINRLHGDVELIHETEAFTVESLVQRIKAFYFDNFEGEVYLVAPIAMLFEVMNAGLAFRFFEMESKRAFEGERPLPIVKAVWGVSSDCQVKYEI